MQKIQEEKYRIFISNFKPLNALSALNNMTKITKEQLQNEVAKTKQLNEILSLKDERTRKEFAKAFHWHKQPQPYSGAFNEPPEPIIPSWEQIWVNLGTLLAARNFMDYEGNISELEMKLEDLEKRLLKNVNPNL